MIATWSVVERSVESLITCNQRRHQLCGARVWVPLPSPRCSPHCPLDTVPPADYSSCSPPPPTAPPADTQPRRQSADRDTPSLPKQNSRETWVGDIMEVLPKKNTSSQLFKQKYDYTVSCNVVCCLRQIWSDRGMNHSRLYFGVIWCPTPTATLFISFDPAARC